MKRLIGTSRLLLLFFFLPSFAFTQCKTFADFNQIEQDTLMRSYVIYRDYLKADQLTKAFEHWKYVYKFSPAVNGRHTAVYDDGVIFYSQKFYQEKNEKGKRKILLFIRELMEERAACYPESTAVKLDHEIRQGLDNL